MRSYVCALAILLALSGKSQLSGVLTVPFTYTSIASVINALNTQSISSGVTIAIAAGYIETAPPGGYTLSVSGNSTNPILFTRSGNGANPIINAYTGNKTPGASSQDGIWRFAGCDFITIDGIDLFDVNTQNPQTMEFGFGFFKGAVSDGCQNNTIMNCTITLNSNNNAAGGFPAGDGSRGIEMVNATMNAHTSSLQTTTSAGSNSSNTFKSNLIRNCFTGIVLHGFPDASPYLNADNNNVVGGLLASEGNTVVNYGGSGNIAAAGIKTQWQYASLIGNNKVNNNDGSHQDHPVTLRGIYVNTAPAASCSITSNQITINGGGTSSQITAIENNSGTGGLNNLVAISNNQILNCTYRNSISGAFYGIVNGASSASLSINGNSLTANSTNALGGSVYLLHNSGQIGSVCQISANRFNFQFNAVAGYSAALSCINNTGGNSTATLSVNNNTFNNVVFQSQGSGNVSFINNSGDYANLNISNNLWSGLNLNNTAAVYCINNSSSTQSLMTVCNNSVNSFYRNTGGNTYFYYGSANSPGLSQNTYTANRIDGITTIGSGSGNFYGIYDTEGNTSPFPKKTVQSNTLTNISVSGSGNAYGIYLSDLGDGNSASGSTIANNLLNGISSNGNTYGFYVTSPVSPAFSASLSNNQILNLSSGATTGSVYGCYVNTNNSGLVISQNKIADCFVSGTAAAVFGIFTNSTGIYELRNNLVGNLFAPNASGNNRVNGIYINAGTLLKLYHNTIHLNASSTGINFGTNALYTATSASVTLRNNILMNLSVPAGTGITAAYRRSSSSITTYSPASNNNIFYAGNPGPANVLFSNGTTSYQTLSAFQAGLAPRENLSASQFLSFNSLFGNVSGFLHLSPIISGPAESGAQNVGVDSDIDAEPRQGSAGYAGTGTAPDIGADEFDLNLSPCNTVSIAPISALSLSLCSGQSGILNAGNFSGGSGLSFQWQSSTVVSGPFTNVTGGTGANANEYTTPSLSAGVYYYRLLIACINNTNLATSNIISLTVTPAPSVSASINNSVQCLGATVNFSVAGNPNQQFTWLGPAGFFSSVQNPTLLVSGISVTGIYSVVSGFNNCLSTSSLTIVVSSVSASLTADPDLICPGQQSTLTVSSAASSYSWINASSVSSVALVNPIANTNYSVVVTNSDNCSITKSISVSFITPTIVTQGAQLCLPQNTATLSANAFTPSIINWYPSPLSNSVINTGNSYLLNSQNSQTLFVNASAVRQVSISSTYSPNVSMQGIMFDLQTQNSIYINGFDLELASANGQTVEIWHKTGSFVGFENSSNAWTYDGFVSVPSSQQGSLTLVALNNMLPVLASQSIALYIAVSSSLFCSNTGTNGTSSMSNADLNVLTGNAGPYFNVNNLAHSLNGMIRYLRTACTSSLVPVVLSVVAPPTLSVLSQPSIICSGSSATLSASGANSYSWTGLGISGTLVTSPLSNSIYTVTGFSAPGCGTSSTINVGVFPLNSLTLTASAASVCPQQSVVLTASGANSFTWSTGPNGPSAIVFPVTNSSYTVFGTDPNNCVLKQSLSVSTKSLPIISVLPVTQTVCPGTQFTLNASGALSYTWLPGFSYNSGYTGQTYADAVYNVIGLGINSCTNNAFALVMVDVCEGIENFSISATGKVYPNPFDERIYFSAKDHDVEIAITDLYGRKWFEEKFTVSPIFVDTKLWLRGIYFVSIRNEMSNVIYKLVKE